MRLFITDLLVFLGSLMLIFSYYYLNRMNRRYLRNVERRMERSKGWEQDFYKVFYAIHTADLWGLPLFGSIIAYLLIGFGITASLYSIRSTESADLYAYIIIAVAIPFNFVLLMFERRQETKKSIKVMRLLAVNAVISASLILGTVLRKGDIGGILTVAIIYFVIVFMLMILPALSYFEKHKG